MGVIAEFTIEAETFVLGSVMAAEPEMEIELDRIVPTTGRGVPYLWATNGDFDELERIVAENPLIESMTAVDHVDDSVLYRIEWHEDTQSLLQELSRANVTVLEAYRADEDWFFRLRFDDHADLVKFHEFCSENEIRFQVRRVYPDADRQSQSLAFGLTPEQRDTLVLAVDRGYFAVPRGVTLGEIAAEFGITQQAASERVRRAANKVLRTVLVPSF